MEQNHKPEGCQCPMHAPVAGVRPFEKVVGHVRKGSTFYKGGFEMTDTEFDGLMRQFVLGSRRTAEPEEQADPAAQQQGFSNEDMAKLFGAFVNWMENFRAAAPVVNVAVAPKLEVPETVEKTEIVRDEQGRMVGSTKTVRPK